MTPLPCSKPRVVHLRGNCIILGSHCEWFCMCNQPFYGHSHRKDESHSLIVLCALGRRTVDGHTKFVELQNQAHTMPTCFVACQYDTRVGPLLETNIFLPGFFSHLSDCYVVAGMCFWERLSPSLQNDPPLVSWPKTRV